MKKVIICLLFIILMSTFSFAIQNFANDNKIDRKTLTVERDKNNRNSATTFNIEKNMLNNDNKLLIENQEYIFNFDWRNYNGKNWVSPIKDQGGCWSSWVFSVTGIVESRVNINLDKNNYNIDISEQDIISCSLLGNCGGGIESDALSYIKNNGVVKESCFGYTASDVVCNKCSNSNNELIKIDYTGVLANANSIKEAISNYGPVTAYMIVCGDFNGNGIYSRSDDEWGDVLEDDSCWYEYDEWWYLNLHTISIIGYSDSGSYWIGKNSWGTGWGDGGYFKIAYSQSIYDFDVWYDDLPYYLDNRVFFLDDSYVVTNTDIDNDGIDDSIDNCPYDSNIEQLDTDNENLENCNLITGKCGDVCDNDDDNDGVLDENDDCLIISGPAYNNGCPDITPANITINSPINNFVYNSLNIFVNITTNELVSFFITWANGNYNINNTNNVFFMLDNLEEGTQGLLVETIDYSDNFANKNILFSICIPKWEEINTSCLDNNIKTGYYFDINNCNVSETPPFNVTYDCDYCVPNWIEVNTSCLFNDRIVGYYNDSNSCYNLTGLSSDNIPPDNNTYSCDFCVPNWTKVNTSCLFDDNIIEYYNDLNSCYNLTGVELDNIPPDNNTYFCDFCVPNWECNGYSSCLINDTQFCNSVNDTESCYLQTSLSSDEYLGNYSEYNYSTCDYCTPDWECSDYDTCQTNDRKQCNQTNDINVCYMKTNLSSDLYSNNFSELKLGYCDYNNDGVIGTFSDINTTLNNASIIIKNETVEFKEGNNTVIEFNFNFSNGYLNFFNIIIEKQNNTQTRGYIRISGINLTSQNKTKTVYIERIDSNSNKICILDAEVDSIDDMSSDCSGLNEVSLNCNGVQSGSYRCTLNSLTYKLEGLSHSAAIEYTYTAPSGGNSGGGGGGGGGGGSPEIQEEVPIEEPSKKIPLIEINLEALKSKVEEPVELYPEEITEENNDDVISEEKLKINIIGIIITIVILFFCLVWGYKKKVNKKINKK